VGYENGALLSRKESSSDLIAKSESARDDVEQGGVFVQSLSLEEQTPSQISIFKRQFRTS
jgi:hypothetical protein